MLFLKARNMRAVRLRYDQVDYRMTKIVAFLRALYGAD